MTFTNTTSSTFTIANARYVTSKVKADLALMQRIYGAPSDAHIENLGEEAAQLLNKGYLGRVTYGFRRDGDWIVALRYTANRDGTLATDDRAGQVPRGIDISGAEFHSFLSYSVKKDLLTASAWATFKATLPIQRTGGEEPGTSGGYWTEGNTYSSNGSGLSRKTWVPL